VIILPLPYQDEDRPEPLGRSVPLIIALNVVIYFILPEKAKMFLSFIGDAPLIHKVFTSISSQFLHADISHLGGNMWFLWLFGPRVEKKMGKAFWPFYLGAGLAANLAFLFSADDERFSLLGASGAISGVIGAYCFMFWNARLKCVSWLIYRPFYCTVDAAAFGLFYFGMDYFSMKMSGTASSVAHVAHLGGAAVGLIVGFFLQEGRPVDAPDDPWDFSRLRAGYNADDSAQSVLTAMQAQRGGEAIEAFRIASGIDAGFMLPVDQQYAIAEAAARSGKGYLARAGLKRLIRKHPLDATGAAAKLLIGWIEAHLCGNIAAGADATAGVIGQGGATEQQRQQAREQVAAAQTAQAQAFNAAAGTGNYWLLLDGASALKDNAIGAAARLIGKSEEELRASLGATPGVLASGVKWETALHIGKELKTFNVPILAVAEENIAALPSAVWLKSLAVGDSGLVFTPREGSPVQVAWGDLSAIAAGGLVLPDDPAEKEKSNAPKVLHFIDIVVGQPAGRFRWVADVDLGCGPQEQMRFFDALQDLVHHAEGVPVLLGGQAAFDRELPRHAVVGSMADFDRLLGWQLQLAKDRAAKMPKVAQRSEAEWHAGRTYTVSEAGAPVVDGAEVAAPQKFITSYKAVISTWLSVWGFLLISRFCLNIWIWQRVERSLPADTAKDIIRQGEQQLHALPLCIAFETFLFLVAGTLGGLLAARLTREHPTRHAIAGGLLYVGLALCGDLISDRPFEFNLIVKYVCCLIGLRMGSTLATPPPAIAEDPNAIRVRGQTP
jgi:membrane associated rhomboid family serine protease